MIIYSMNTIEIMASIIRFDVISLGLTRGQTLRVLEKVNLKDSG